MLDVRRNSLSFYFSSTSIISSLAAVDTKPPKAMILGQKCRDRARKEMAQVLYAQNLIDQFSATNPTSARATPRGRSSQSARFAQSQVLTENSDRFIENSVHYFSQLRIVLVHEVLNRPVELLVH